MSSPRVFVLDHRDSFVFLLGEQFARLGADVRTLRADLPLSLLQQRIAEYAADLVVLSPGPGRPEDAATTVAWLRTAPAQPVLGICLGHQAMAVAFGGEVARAPRPAHGTSSVVELARYALFAGLPPRLHAGRYHSLAVTRVPTDFEVLAHTHDAGRDLVMAMRHRTRPWLGLQFHPESVLTPHGGLLAQRVLQQAVVHARGAAAPCDLVPVPVLP